MPTQDADSAIDDNYERWTGRKAYVLGLLTLIYALNTVDRNLLGLMAPLIKADLGLSDSEIGLLSGFAFAALYAIAGIPIASLADRWNRRNIIAIGLAFWSLMTFCQAFVRTTWQLAVARFLLGAGEASSVAPSNSMIADLFGPRTRPFALGFLAAANSIGILLAFPILGYISEIYDWRAAFIAAGIPGILIAILLFFTVREPERQNVATEGAGSLSLGATLSRLSRIPSFVLIVTSGTFISMDLAITLTWTPTLLSRIHELSQSEIGSNIGLLRGISGIVGGVGGGLVTSWLGARDKRWRYRTPALAMLLIVPAQLLLIFGGTAGTWKAGLAIETLMLSAMIGPMFALILAASDIRTRAVAVASFLFVTNLVGQTAGPLLSGLASDALTPALGVEAIRYAMLIGTAGALIASMICLAGGRRISE